MIAWRMDIWARTDDEGERSVADARDVQNRGGLTQLHENLKSVCKIQSLLCTVRENFGEQL